MDTTTPTGPPALPEVRAKVLMLDLVRAYVGGDWNGAADLLAEFNQSFRMLQDPMGGLNLHNLAQNALELMFEQLMIGLGVDLADLPRTMPAAALTGQLYALLGEVELDPDVLFCLLAFCRGDLPAMLDTPRSLRSVGWFVVVALAVAVAGCVHHEGVVPYLAVLDGLRAEAAA